MRGATPLPEFGRGPKMFDKAAAAARQRKEVQVIITLNGQGPFDGVVFPKADERLSDLLNDGRAFIPIRRADGPMIFVSKASIVSMLEMPAPAAKKEDEIWRAKAEEHAERPGASHREEEEPASSQKTSQRSGKKALDPYEVLRVPRTATLEEIRKAYKARIKAVHPDTIAALDLDEDLERAANATAQKVNYAYHRIMCERERTKDAAPEAGAA